MAKRHRSAMKRVRQDAKKRIRHRKTKTEVKVAVKKVRESKTAEDLTKVYSVIDKARKKGVLHRKTAARKKSRLAKAINKAKTNIEKEGIQSSKPKAKSPKLKTKSSKLKTKSSKLKTQSPKPKAQSST